MIPKTIHFCWLSGETMPAKMRRCRASWRRHLPGYAYALWDWRRVEACRAESGFDFAWVRHWYERKNYAFAADYLRLWALWREGGIYLDVDVEVLKPFGDLINLNKKADRERYAQLQKERKTEDEEQPYEIATNVPVVRPNHPIHTQDTPDRDNEILQLTILGIPNSGKSTLLNTLLKKDRFITGSIPGLTRDTVSSEVEYKGRRIRVVDTPGIPKADGVLPPSLNSLSIYHAHKQLQYSHVVALILDGSRILTKHDLALAKEVGVFIRVESRCWTRDADSSWC